MESFLVESKKKNEYLENPNTLEIIFLYKIYETKSI